MAQSTWDSPRNSASFTTFTWQSWVLLCFLYLQGLVGIQNIRETAWVTVWEHVEESSWRGRWKGSVQADQQDRQRSGCCHCKPLLSWWCATCPPALCPWWHTTHPRPHPRSACLVTSDWLADSGSPHERQPFIWWSLRCVMGWLTFPGSDSPCSPTCR